MDLQLSGKVALVTGASRRIGRAIAETLAPQGLRVTRFGEPAESVRAVAFLGSPAASYC